MPATLPLQRMSRAEKLRAMEALWADLSKDDAYVSPAWHGAALREAEQALADGSAKFTDWNAAKERLRRRAAKLA